MRHPTELSRREREVALLVAEGMTNKQIAARLFIAERTAEGHVEQIRNKLGFTSRSQIAAWVAATGREMGKEKPGRLPRPLSSLVGRHAEIGSAVDQVLGKPLVTICGPGGIGKTRLAIEVGREIEPRFPGGAWLVELAAVADKTAVAGAISDALELTQAGSEPAEEQLGRFLSGRKALLVLDNCEHLIHECARLAENLLSRSTELRILATSREPLGLAGERVFRLGPLSFSADGGARSEAVELLAERSRDVGGDLPEDDLMYAAAICEHLDGIPLAIELAAAQTAVLSLGEIAMRLDDRFRFLKSDLRTTVPRQQTLRAAVDWSYQLLSSEERVAFRRLAVFAGDFAVDAAAAVLELDEIAAVELIGSLIRKSMLGWREPASGHRRYQMLETLREFARETLSAEGEAEIVQSRHASFYLDLARRAFPHLRSGESDIYAARLDEERDNLHTALQFLAVHSPDEFVELVSRLGRYWIRGRLRDGYLWTERAIRTGLAHRQVQLDLLETWSWLTFQRNEIDIANQTAQRLLDEGTRAGSAFHIGRAMNFIAMFSGERGTPADADYWRRAETVLRDGGAEWALALLLNDRGFFSSFHGGARQGLDDILEALDLAKQVGDRWLVGMILDSAAWANVELGQLDVAAALWKESLENLDPGRDVWGLPYDLEGFARVARLQGDLKHACVLLGAAAGIRGQQAAHPLSSWTNYIAADIEALRSAMPGEEFDSGWNIGLTMSTDQAREFALGRVGSGAGSAPDHPPREISTL